MSTLMVSWKVEDALKQTLVYLGIFRGALFKQRISSAMAPNPLGALGDLLGMGSPNPYDIENLIFQQWAVDSDSYYVGARPGSWIIGLRQNLDFSATHILGADFARLYPPPSDFFNALVKPLSQAKTRRRVTKLKHHRFGYVLEKVKGAK